MFRVVALVGAITLVGGASNTNGGSVDFLWSGAITTFSARVKVKVSTEGLTGRVAFSPYADFSYAIFSDEQTAILATNGRVLDFRLRPLRPDTRYFYAASFDGVIDTSLVGHISGDTNGTGEVDISDLTMLVAYLFNSSPPAIIKQSADMDQNGQIDISDLTLLVEYMFDRP